ncbi:MAG TPA: hypothetical protein VH497_21575 [Vicinamibacterales bacterium]
MDSRETWKTLQAKLALARERLEAGDFAAAREAVDAALEIDPEFLAAHSLRQRIELDSLTATPREPSAQAPVPPQESQESADTSIEAASPPPDMPPPLPVTLPSSTANHRRFGSMLADVYERKQHDDVERHEKSIPAFFVTEHELPSVTESELPISEAPVSIPEVPAAMAYVDEPATPYETESLTSFESEPPGSYEELPGAYEKLPDPYEELPRAYVNELPVPDALRTGTNVTDTGFIELRLNDDADAGDSVHYSDLDSPASRSTGIIQVVVGAAALIAVILVERPDRYQNAIRDFLRWPEQSAAVTAPPAPLISSSLPVQFTELVAGGQSANFERPAPAASFDREAVAVPAMRAASNEPVAAVSRTPAQTAAPAMHTVKEGPTARVTEPPPTTMIVATADGPVEVPAPPPSEPAPAPRPTPPPAAAAAVPTSAVVDDEQGVKQALQRYRSAYDRLDARLARNVWPTVNEAALARAFDSLQSQSLTFNTCDVAFKGPAAVATCEGTMRYTPRVGARDSRIEPHVWTFTLRKRGPDWEIDSVKAAR